MSFVCKECDKEFIDLFMSKYSTKDRPMCFNCYTNISKKWDFTTNNNLKNVYKCGQCDRSFEVGCYLPDKGKNGFPICLKCHKDEVFNRTGRVKTISEKFKKNDKGKLRYDLIPPVVLEALAKVITHGAEKYGDNNWKKAKSPDRYIAAMFRHIEAWRKGEVKDEDSGFLHLYHALTNIAFLVYLESQPKVIAVDLADNKDEHIFKPNYCTLSSLPIKEKDIELADKIPFIIDKFVSAYGYQPTVIFLSSQEKMELTCKRYLMHPKEVDQRVCGLEVKIRNKIYPNIYCV